MANTNFLKLITTILSLLLILHYHSQTTAFSTHPVEDEDDDYIVDNPSSSSSLAQPGPKRKFLVSIIKKGTRCDPVTYNVCNGVWANKGTGLLFCCKKHCRNVLGDRNNCGRCGQRCSQAERCCNGVCTHVFFNGHHCGKCNKACPPGVSCQNGFCGYA